MPRYWPRGGTGKVLAEAGTWGGLGAAFEGLMTPPGESFTGRAARGFAESAAIGGGLAAGTVAGAQAARKPVKKLMQAGKPRRGRALRIAGKVGGGIAGTIGSLMLLAPFMMRGRKKTMEKESDFKAHVSRELSKRGLKGAPPEVLKKELPGAMKEIDRTWKSKSEAAATGGKAGPITKKGEAMELKDLYAETFEKEAEAKEATVKVANEFYNVGYQLAETLKGSDGGSASGEKVAEAIQLFKNAAKKGQPIPSLKGGKEEPAAKAPAGKGERFEALVKKLKKKGK